MCLSQQTLVCVESSFLLAKKCHSNKYLILTTYLPCVSKCYLCVLIGMCSRYSSPVLIGVCSRYSSLGKPAGVCVC